MKAPKTRIDVYLLGALGAAALTLATACGSSGGSTSDAGEDATTDTGGKMDVDHPESGPDDAGHDAREHDSGTKDVQPGDEGDSGPSDAPTSDSPADGSFDSPPPYDVIPPPFDVIPPPFDVIPPPFDVIPPPFDVVPPPFDVIPPPLDAPTPDGAACTGFGGYGGGGPGTCEVGTDYSCGPHSYTISCDCPSARCSCEKDGLPYGAPSSYTGCPSCGLYPDFASIAAFCGIPY